MEKTILITGGTGTIGMELALRQLEERDTVYLPVRNLEKAAIFASYPNAHVSVQNLMDRSRILAYLTELMKQGIVFDYVFLFAGDLRKDHTFEGITKEEKEKQSIKYHYEVNVLTARTVINALKEVFGERTRSMTLEITSSWAAYFPVGDAYREDEEGYVQSKALLSGDGKALQQENCFKEVVIEEPRLIVSTITNREFPDLIGDPNVPKQTAVEYVNDLRKRMGL